MKKIGDLLSLSARLKLARGLRGLSATETGNLIGRNRAHIERIERGQASRTTLIELIQLAASYHVPLVDILMLAPKHSNHARVIIIDSNVRRSLRTEKLAHTAYSNINIKRYTSIEKAHRRISRYSLNLIIVTHNAKNNAPRLIKKCHSTKNRGVVLLIMVDENLQEVISLAKSTGNLFYNTNNTDDVLINIISDAVILT